MNRVPIQDAHISFMQGYFFVVYKLRHFSIIYINKFYDRVNMFRRRSKTRLLTKTDIMLIHNRVKLKDVQFLAIQNYFFNTFVPAA